VARILKVAILEDKIEAVKFERDEDMEPKPYFHDKLGVRYLKEMGELTRRAEIQISAGCAVSVDAPK
jgi:hypothetical protein